MYAGKTNTNGGKKKKKIPKINNNFPQKDSIVYCYNILDLRFCLKQCKKNESNKYTIIQSRTDHPLTKKASRIIPENVSRIFSHNINTTRKGKIIPLPYGIKFDKQDQKRDKKNLYLGSFHIPKQINYAKRKLLYCNFSISCHGYGRTLRPRLYTKFSHKKLRKWITLRHMGKFGKYPISQSEYYKDINKHKFTLSPQGSGIDCYRTWEAIYLKSIPIVQKSRHLNHFSDLPILFTDDDYGEINKRYLKERYEEMLEKEINIEKLKRSYWKDLILKQNQL